MLIKGDVQGERRREEGEYEGRGWREVAKKENPENKGTEKEGVECTSKFNALQHR